MRNYISYGFWLALVGAVLGILLGPLTLPYLFYPSLSSAYTLPDWSPAFDPSFAIMGLVMVTACTFITYLACRKLLRDTLAKTLRPKSPKFTKHSFLETTSFWQRLGFN